MLSSRFREKSEINQTQNLITVLSRANETAGSFLFFQPKEFTMHISANRIRLGGALSIVFGGILLTGAVLLFRSID
jgi:hypothetical protein